MADLSQLDCKVYLEAPLPLEELARLLSQQLKGRWEASRFAATLRLPSAEVEVRKNEDADARRAAEFPDGFLYFQYALEVFVNPEAQGEQRVSMIAEFLRVCWENGWPAVASCDYEENLPERGGYKSRATPWPGVQRDGAQPTPAENLYEPDPSGPHLGFLPESAEGV